MCGLEPNGTQLNKKIHVILHFNDTNQNPASENWSVKSFSGHRKFHGPPKLGTNCTSRMEVKRKKKKTVIDIENI